MAGTASATGGIRTRLRPGTILVILLSLLAILAIGCGGLSASAPDVASAGKAPSSSEARLLVTQDFGATLMLDVVAAVSPGLTVMNMLSNNAEVKTEYGGGFVSAINGVESTFKQTVAERAKDWFYWVNGKMANVGAAAYDLHGGEIVWWDYHEWAGAMNIPWCLGAVPTCFAGQNVELYPALQATVLEAWMGSLEITGDKIYNLETTPHGLAVVLVDLPQAAQIPWITSALEPGSGTGVFVTLENNRLFGTTADGDEGPALTAAAAVLPSPDQSDEPVLLLVAKDTEALDALLGSLTVDVMACTVNLGLGENGTAVKLPVTETSP